MADIAARCAVHPNQICAWRKQPLDNAARAFDPGVGIDADQAREGEIEKLHAKIGQLTVKNSFFGADVRTMSTPDRKAVLDRGLPEVSIRRERRVLGIARSRSISRCRPRTARI